MVGYEQLKVSLMTVLLLEWDKSGDMDASASERGYKTVPSW